MELTYKELSKREVINIVDGKSLGRITNLTLSFPGGKLSGITVPGKNQNFFSKIFSKSELYIPVNKILKIGNDVILVNLSCGDTCGDAVPVSNPPRPKPQCNPCQPNFNFNGGRIDPSDYDGE